MNLKRFSNLIPDTNVFLIIITICVIIIAVYNSILGIIGLLLLAYLVYYNLKSANRKKEELKLYIENLSEDVDTATKGAILNLPFPLVILDQEGRINWYNSMFAFVFHGEYLLDQKLNEYVAGVDVRRVLKNGNDEFSNINIKDRFYDLHCNVVKLTQEKEEKQIIIMYLVDKTDYTLLKLKHNEEKSAVAVISIDNFDEVIKEAEEADRPGIVAEIDKKINLWAIANEASIQKYSSGDYVVHISMKHLAAVEEKRFDLLDVVRDLNVGNRMPATLSIGVGVNGESLSELQHAARSAMDIALGRGGDQAVIKDNEKLSFYGGKTKTLEKRTRVKARVIAYALKQLIEQSENILIMGHQIPDLDCLGSALGINRCCRNLGKNSKIIISGASPAVANLWKGLAGDPDYADTFISPADAAAVCEPSTLVICVDVHRPSFTEAPGILQKSERIAIIDHHRRGSEFIEDGVISYIEPYASSSSELITEIIQYMFEKPKLKQIEAEALLAGIFIDTKNFSFQTGVRTFEAASWLRKMGADTTNTRQLFQDDMEAFLVRADVVKRAKLYRTNIAISSIPEDAKSPSLAAAQAADELLNIRGITASFVLSMADGVIYISGRSLGDINVQLILEKLGGGGHLTVAGAQIAGTSIEQAILTVENAVEEYLKEGEKQ